MKLFVFYITLTFYYFLISIVATGDKVPQKHALNTCVMNDEDVHGKPYFRNIPAPELTDNNSITMIKELCGNAAKDILSSHGPSGHPRVCCSSAQVYKLTTSIQLAVQMLASCSACFQNFVSFWCHFTCNPHQSTFLQVTNTTKGIVDTVDFYVTRNFADSLWDSCKDVKFNADNSRSVSLVAPGSKDGLSFLRKVGMKQPPFNPLQINFADFDQPYPHVDADEEKFAPLNVTNAGCDDKGLGCSCTDCFKSCPASYPPDYEHLTCHIGNTNWECIAFGATLAYVIITVFILALALLRRFHSAFQYAPLSEDSESIPETDYDDVKYAKSVGGNDDDEQVLLLLGDEKILPHSTWVVDRLLRTVFRKLGYLCARYPWQVIMCTIILVIGSCFGWRYFTVETKPINLWVDPSSKALREKQFFDQNFSPFYRVTQVILSKNNQESIFDWESFMVASSIQKSIESIRAQFGDKGESVRLDDLCFKPTDKACATQSVIGWYDKSPSIKLEADHDLKHARECINKPGDLSCLAASMQPLQPNLVLGGITRGHKSNWTDATALVLTFVLNASVDEALNARAIAWERTVSAYLKQLKLDGYRLSFSTEISIEDELSSETSADIPTVIISYLLMFLYASLALGKLQIRNGRWSRLFVNTRFSLGVCGILIVIASVVSSIGILSFARQKATLIIAEVIPFLVLAVGVDNIFIIVNTFDRITREFRAKEGGDKVSVETRVAETMSLVGASIFLSSSCETLAFGLGIAVTMPAVSIFSAYAAVAVFINFLLQTTCFVSCLTLDAYRRESNRIDCLPFLTIGSDDQDDDEAGEVDEEPFLENAFRKYFAPVILSPKVKPLIIFAFVTFFVFGGLFNLSKVELGLDQRLALPRNSHLISYFDAIEDYLEVGPPIYFVFKGRPPSSKDKKQGLDMTSSEDQTKICGKFRDCNEWSVNTLLEMEFRKNDGKSGLASPTSIWFDDFVYYMNNIGLPCCAKTGDRRDCFIDLDPDVPPEDEDDQDFSNIVPECACMKWRLLSPGSAPEPDRFGALFNNYLRGNPSDPSDIGGVPKDPKEFINYLQKWLNDVPGTKCPTAGKAAYGSSLAIGETEDGQKYVKAFVLRSYHKTLRTQRDFIEAVQQAKKISKNLMEMSLGVSPSEDAELDPVYAYSIFYVFFEQYETIWSLASSLILFALLAIFSMVLLFVGSPTAAFSIVLVVAMMVIDLIGIMAMWNISLNAVSTVNLVIAAGIGVEFCVHVARGAVIDKSTFQSLTEMGSSVFSGITLTKLVGIIVLAFAHSRIFEVFYFRMYLAIVILGATHGLILLPCILDYAFYNRK